jgi:hypothetical protein
VNIGKNFITPTIKSDGDKIQIGKNDRTNDVFMPRKHYTIKADFGGGDLFSVSKLAMPNITEALKYCSSRHDCSIIEENTDSFWFKTCNDGNWMVAGKDWPDEMFGCGGVSGNDHFGGDVKVGIPSNDVLDCKKQCKETPGCDYIQYQVNNKNCWLRRNGNTNKQISAHFINHKL